MNKIKLLIAIVISLMPFNFFRIILYRLLLRYEISFSSKIGIFTIIAINSAKINNSYIGCFNRFRGPFTLEINSGTHIGDKNEFICGDWVCEREFMHSEYVKKCKIGENTRITTLHFIDTTGGFELQDNSWIAGRQSQFWTHGAGVTDRSIIIGKNCYIGSSVNFAPGVIIGDNNLVALGSVVTKKFNINNALIGGVPARIIRENYKRNYQNKN